MLLMAESRQDLKRQSQEVLALLRLLGLRINLGKSQLLPTHKLVCLGLTIDTTLMILTLPEEKKRCRRSCQPTLRKDMVSVRDLSRQIGMKSATTLVVLPAPLHYRELQDLKVRTLKKTVLPGYGVSDRGIKGRA